MERASNGGFVHTELVRHPKLDREVAGVKEANTYCTNLQYELLAYAYIVCSMRKVTLLEVTIHRELDRALIGYKDGKKVGGHNDPQHFNMDSLYSKINELLEMPTNLLESPVLDLTYGIADRQIKQLNGDNWSGYINEFIPYVEAKVNRAEQYRKIAIRKDSSGKVIEGDYDARNIKTKRHC